MNNDIVYLNPDLSKTWGSVLKQLRESGEHMLHAAAAEINDIEITDNEIKLHCPNQSLFNLFSKYKTKLNEFAKADVFQIIAPSKGNRNTEKIEKLKELFGDKLVLK